MPENFPAAPEPTAPDLPVPTPAAPTVPEPAQPAKASQPGATAEFTQAPSWPRPTRPFDDSPEPGEEASWPRPTATTILTTPNDHLPHPGTIEPAEPEPTAAPLQLITLSPAVSVIASSPDSPARGILETPEKRKRKTVLIVIIIVVLALVLAGLGYYFLPRFLANPDKPGNAVSPTEAVQEYLAAVASGDATTALLYSQTKPGEDTFFTTDDFLKASMKAAPITNIDVPGDQSTTSPAQIQATYTLNGQKIQAHFTVQKYGQLWKLDVGFLPLNLTELTNKGVPLAVNGVSLDLLTKIYLFPGVYTFTSKNPILDLTVPTFTIDYPENPTIFREGFTLSQDGITAIQTAASAQLTACLAIQELQPLGCGFGFAGTTEGEVDTTSIKWTLADDAPDISTITPALDGNSITVATATIDIGVNFEAKSTDNRHLYDGTSSFNTVRADFSDPNNIHVTFGTV